MNIQDWFPLGLTGWISLLSKGLKSLLQIRTSQMACTWLSVVMFVCLWNLPGRYYMVFPFKEFISWWGKADDKPITFSIIWQSEDKAESMLGTQSTRTVHG